MKVDIKKLKAKYAKIDKEQADKDIESNVAQTRFEPHKLARTTDPGTSKKAARSVKGLRETQFSAILEVMKTPMAAEQVGDVLGYDCWKRFSELESEGLIVKTEKRHINRSGRQAIIWRKL